MRSLSLAEIAEFTKTGPRVAPPHQHPTLGPVCDHVFQPAKTIVTSPSLKEFPTKKCTLCDLWLCLQPDEVNEEAIADMGDWLAYS